MAKNNTLNADGLLALEQPLLKVPLEQYKRAIKNTQKAIEKDLSSKIQTTNLLQKLTNLKRKLQETKQEEDFFNRKTRNRIQHLTELSTITTLNSEAFSRWSKTKLDRMMVDYFLRIGYNSTAQKIAQEFGIQDLVDLELFSQAKKIEDALRRRSCTECLAWCNENKSSLKKIKSTLEFNLRIQEYAELIRGKKLPEAIAYAKKYLTLWAETHLREIQQATALLAFSPTTRCDVYRKYFDESRYSLLILQFRNDNYNLNQLPVQPMFRIALQAGLAALKTTSCYHSEDQNVHCPTCQGDTFGKLAQKLPMAQHLNSRIVCRISGKVMDENNPPMVLPNGYTYSLEAVKELAEKNNGVIKCPRSGSTFTMSQLRKAFIL